jgi:magnesium transporter
MSSLRPSLLPPPSPCTVRVVSFDFELKQALDIALSDVQSAIAEGKYIWLELDATEPIEAKGLLATLFSDDEVIEAVLAGGPGTHHVRHDAHLHVTLTGCNANGEHIELERVDVLITERVVATIHRGPVGFLTGVRRDYKSDFLRFAKSPSFLLYEIFDHLLDNYVSVHRRMQGQVDAVHQLIRSSQVSELTFRQVFDLSSDLLDFRRILIAVRSVLKNLGARKTPFVSEASQPFLSDMAETVDSILNDVLVERDVLAEALNIYLSTMGHRTNESMRRLTVFSILFLPLALIADLYGITSEEGKSLIWPMMPTIQHAYQFWLGMLVMLTLLLGFLRRVRLI